MHSRQFYPSPNSNSALGDMARTSLEETARTEGGEAAAETITEQSTAGNSQPLSAAQKKRQKKKRAAARKAAAAGEDDQHDGHIGDEDGIKQNESQSSKRGKGAAAQTDPAEVQVRILFNGMEFPAGERRSYSNDNAWRETDEEKRHQENMDARDGGALHDARCAAEVHREARMLFKKHAQPGVKLIDLCEQLESNVRTMIEADGLKAGVAFPTGVSLNNIAAHWTPNPGDTTVLNESDVMKVDFGTQVNGRIIDSAFTLSHDPQFDKLLEASKEATEAGIRAAGIDARLNELGDAIQEVMESYEVEINGKPHQVRCVQNLNGHNIAPYTIHAGKSIPLTRGGPATKMEEGEFFAVETFGSTGKG